MSDALRTVLSVGRSALGRIGQVGPRSRSRQDEVRVGGLRGRLFRKYVLLLVGLVGVVLLVNAGLQSWFSYEENKASLFRIQQEKARSAAHRIEGFVEDIEHQLGWTAAPQWAASPIEQRRFDLVRLLHQAPAITELIQLDDHGKEQLKVSRLAMDVVGSGKNYSQSPDFIEAQKHRVWFSPVYFRKESEPYMTVAMAEAERNAGVTIAEVNLKLIWDVIAGLKLGEHGYAYVIDRDGRLIAHPDISLVLRDTDLTNLPQVAAARAEAQADQFAPPVIVAKNINGEAVLTAHAAVVPLGWTVFVELPLSDALAPLYGSAWRMAALFALALVLATLAALFLARRMVVPIRLLQAGAVRIGAGELDRRIDIRTGDELEELAGEFNRMAGDLQNSYADLERKVEERTAELQEALDQQTATAEVLGVINSSPGDLSPVFEAMLEKATRLCEASFGVLCTYDGTSFRAAALRGVPAAYAEFLTAGPLRPGPGNGLTRVAAGEKVVHVVDLAAEGVYRSGEALRRALVDLGGARSALTVGLLKDELLLGAFIIYRREVRAFTDKQIGLVQNFAAQAVIAMENARLITETREALEQQTATAEVLQVINSSPGDLAPVFETILDKAHTLCGATLGSLFLFDGELFRAAATHGYPEDLAQRLRQGVVLSATTQLLDDSARWVHTPDLTLVNTPTARAVSGRGGVRTNLMLPLRKDGRLLGAISCNRQEVRPFADKEIALLENFAAQAVIAMENARLITETREALEQQTATAEVLQVINSSPGDLAPVFDAILEKAHSLCGAAKGALVTYDGERFRGVATRGLSELYAALIREQRDTPPGSPPDRLLNGESLVHVPDFGSLPFPIPRAAAELEGARTVLFVPLRKDSALLGYITAYRQEVRPFSDKQIALLQNFAAQAVIAMENARLITETREALEQQTATAEVLQVINSSPGDLAPVFDAMLEKAVRLCDGALGTLWMFDGDCQYAAATAGMSAELAGQLRKPRNVLGYQQRLRDGERVFQIADLAAAEAYRAGNPLTKLAVEAGGVRTAAFVALVKDTITLGGFTVARREVRPFTDKQIALLQNFAAQAVIAMENARLLTETREALEQQTATAEVLQVINSSPGDLAPVFDAMLDKAMRLCEAAFGTLWTYDGACVHAAALHNVPPVFAEFLTRAPHQVGPDSAHGRLLRGEPVVHIPDIVAEKAYGLGDPIRRALVELGGGRTLLAVPLRKDNAFLGDFVIYRQEARPFSDKQIALLQNFAAQAVIAMENARLITETREALEQQTATTEVLQVINFSPGYLAPVFDAILEKAHNLCETSFSCLLTYDGERFHTVALNGPPVQFREMVGNAFQAGSNNPLMQLVRGERLVHMGDAVEDDGWRDCPGYRHLIDVGSIRTMLLVPLRKDTTLLGAIAAFRREVRPFSDKQVALLQNFAAQAVIAMENARLLTETREALEQQTATAEVLQVINSSPGDLAPVFDAILEKATHLCDVPYGSLELYDGERFRAVAVHGLSKAFADKLQQGYPASDNPATRPLIEGSLYAHITDLAETDYSITQSAVELVGARTLLCVPLRRDNSLLGMIACARQELRPFSEKEIALLQNFAAQAVIAMENARLLGELRQRTHDLQESLEYQIATSDVLKVISRSGAELGPVLDTLVETAARICRAESGFIFRLQDGLCRMVASFGIPAEYRDFQERNPIAPGRGTLAGRTALERRAVHIEDAATDPEYTRPEAVQLGRQRTMLGVPLVREDALIGVITLARTRVEPFTEKQIGLVTTFADQAVIAIENARLFNELRDRTAELGRSVEELKLLSDVGRAVSSTLDLRSVLSAILTASLGVTWANAGAVFRYIRAEHAFRLVEAVGWDETLTRSVRELRIAETESAMGEAAARGMPVQLADLAERPSAPLRDAALAGGFHSALIVPLVGAERILGAITLMRQEAGEFPAETVRLMQTLASQSVLAIQNARLFREIADKSEQLALASQHKSQFLANMSHELRTPLNAILGYAELLVDGIYGALPDRPKGVIERIQNNGKHLLALINDVLDLAKIEAGQLTLTLEDYNLPEVVTSVVTATEPLATSKGLKFTTTVQDNMPMAHGDARRVSQVLLNLVGNAIKFTDAGEVEIRAAAERGQFVLTVRDTGPGIAEADQERIFGEFQQIDNSNTRKQGGTGLGLAISKRMVEMQGGMISVDSVVGKGSTFRVLLPIHVDEVLEEAA